MRTGMAEWLKEMAALSLAMTRWFIPSPYQFTVHHRERSVAISIGQACGQAWRNGLKRWPRYRSP